MHSENQRKKKKEGYIRSSTNIGTNTKGNFHPAEFHSVQMASSTRGSPRCMPVNGVGGIERSHYDNCHAENQPNQIILICFNKFNDKSLFEVQSNWDTKI